MSKTVGLQQNRRRLTTDPGWQVKAVEVRAWKEYAEERGAISVILSYDKQRVVAQYPPGHDQNKFQFWLAPPSGRDVFEDEEDESEFEVTND